MNEYLKNLCKIEFVLTYACTGSCKHCSEGDHTRCGEHIDPSVAEYVVRRVVGEYDIKTVMTFGGEPLLCPEAVFAVMNVARELNVPRRQVITNGYFTNDNLKIRRMAERLSACGVNDLLLSVDSFHQETIPLDVVKVFAKEVTERGIPTRLSPAWLVSAEDDNPYNIKTREILAEFNELAIPIGEGNVVFPEGNAKKYLAEYFLGEIPENPYVDDPRDVRCLSVSPNGDVLSGNVYREDILKILEGYEPERYK